MAGSPGGNKTKTMNEFRGHRPRLQLFRLAPNDVLVVTTVDQGVHFAGGSTTKQNSAFDAFAEENL